MALTREEILAAPDLPVVRLWIPEWNGEVLIRTMTGQERATFEESVTVERDGKAEVDKRLFFAYLLAATLVNEDGTLLFTDHAEVKDGLMGKSGAVLMRIGNKSAKLNGLSAQDQEELLKNSKPIQNGASDTASLSH